MSATDILKSEHRVIEQVLQAVEGMARRAASQQKLDGVDASTAIDFIRNYADKFHHAKEEDLLFTEMAAVGFPREAGPVAVMLHEHDVGRNCVRQMAEAVDGAGKGDAHALQAFGRNADEFANLLRAHIYKEDNILYPMADQAFSAATQSALLSAFSKAEAALGGNAVRDKYTQMASQLLGRYGS